MPQEIMVELEAMMDARWAGLDFGAPWYDRVERKRASVMLERLSTWLSSSSRRNLSLVARELDFRVELDDVVLVRPGRPARGRRRRVTRW